MEGKVSVIGAGIGGLAIAIRLALKGYQVSVFERNPYPGGKLSEFSMQGFRFDRGPSLFTLPALVDELFIMAGRNPPDYLDYQKLETICRYFYADGTIINASSEIEQFAGEIEEKTGTPRKAVIDYLEQSATIYRLTADVFLFRSFSRLSTWFSKSFIRALFQVHKLHVLSSMHELNSKYFKDSRICQLFDRYATYNGSNPYSAPGTLTVIPHLEHSTGAYFPKYGMYTIVESMMKLARELAIDFHFNSAADEICIRHKRVTGIRSGKVFFPSEIVISDIDIMQAYRLMPGVNLANRYIQQERSTSALIFYWGINRQFKELDIHNILFTENYREEFRHLFEYKTGYSDPTIYLFVSSKKAPKDAPEGCENWFVMINMPENTGQDWEKIISESRKAIIASINRFLKTDIEGSIVFEEQLDPVSIENQTSSWHGSLYGPSSNSRLSAFLRHPNKSRIIQGLFFCGGSVHPGGGIPLCLSSAKIVDGFIPAAHSNG